MQELIKADIFFFITSIAVILLTVGVIIALYYIIGILRNVKDITERVDEGSKALAEDLKDLRTTVKSNGFALQLINTFFSKAGRWLKGAPAKTKARTKEKTESADTS